MNRGFPNCLKAVRLAVGLLALAIAMAWAAPAMAQAVRYRVEVEGPDELKKILQNGLTLVQTWLCDSQEEAIYLCSRGHDV